MLKWHEFQDNYLYLYVCIGIVKELFRRFEKIKFYNYLILDSSSAKQTDTRESNYKREQSMKSHNSTRPNFLKQKSSHFLNVNLFSYILYISFRISAFLHARHSENVAAKRPS